MFEQVVKYKWLALSVLIVASVLWVYSLVQQNKSLVAEKQVLVQNYTAVQDSLTKQKDSIQVITSKVSDLNAENSRKDKEYSALQTRYEIALKDIVVHDSPAVTVPVKDSAVVQFSGRQGIVHYDGRTALSLVSQKSIYSLWLTFDEVGCSSQLFLDESDNLWKVRTVSLSPGIILRGISTIDADTYQRLRGVPAATNTGHNSVGFGCLAGTDYVAPGMVVKPSNWMFGVNYRFMNVSLLDRFQVSAYWFMF